MINEYFLPSFIDGVCREGSDGTRVPVINPATEEPFAEVSWGTPEDTSMALEAGNTCVVKTPPEISLVTLALASLFQEEGIPAAP